MCVCVCVAYKCTYACFAGFAGLHAVPLVYQGAEAGYNEDIAE